MTRMRTEKARWRIAIALMVMAVVAAACGGDDESAVSGDDFGFDQAAEATSATAAAASAEDSASAAEAPADVAAPEAATEGEALGSGGGTPVVAQPADIGRDIIFTADLRVSVPDVAAAGEEATGIVESLGGFVFGQETRGGDEPRTILTFRIAPNRFQQALDELGDLGELRNQNVSAEDVTGLVVDLESRIATAETSVERLRTFLAEATVVEEVAALETELLDREQELESLRGQLRTVQDRVALATITLTITEAGVAPGIQLNTTAYRGIDDAGSSCPGNFELVVEEGDDITLCFEIVNVGDAPLTGFGFTDTVLDIELENLTVVFGDAESPLQPGQSLFYAYETTVERTLRTQSRVRAIPLDLEGEEIPNREVANTQSLTVFADEPEGLPGFQDGVRTAIDIIQNIWGVIVLLAGFLLPFIWVIPLVWWLWTRRQGRRAARSERAGAHRAAVTGAAATSAAASVGADPAADSATASAGGAIQGTSAAPAQESAVPTSTVPLRAEPDHVPTETPHRGDAPAEDGEDSHGAEPNESDAHDPDDGEEAIDEAGADGEDDTV